MTRDSNCLALLKAAEVLRIATERLVVAKEQVIKLKNILYSENNTTRLKELLDSGLYPEVFQMRNDEDSDDESAVDFAINRLTKLYFIPCGIC